MSKHRDIQIERKDYWTKFLVNHGSTWAAIDELPDQLGYRVWFFNIEGWISDYLDFSSNEDAEVALLRNNFNRYSEGEFGFLGCPENSFRWWMPENLSDRPYSTGMYWIA
jgi:hypothetical protein